MSETSYGVKRVNSLISHWPYVMAIFILIGCILRYFILIYDPQMQNAL